MAESEKLEALKIKIERMSTPHQLEILTSLQKKGNIPISENQNGSFINLSSFRPSDVAALTTYVEYVEKQEKTLAETETQKKELRDEFF